MKPKEEHSPALLASRFVNSTDRNIFLTGKAGTGKTTFLKQITEHTHKKAVVAAPTGIAAINAGGVTLHSLFHLPFGCFVPVNHGLRQKSINTQVNTPQTLLNSIRMNSHKKRLLNEMELLIIDEVSMLRADILDAIDVTLRYIRRKKGQIFGGVQILFIGDLLQLPPVVKNDEKNLLQPYYPSEFFFEAHAIKDNPPLYIELDKIYRQTDEQFISLLNHFRDNEVTREDLELINSHYKPGYKGINKNGNIYLTTHNHKANEINQKALNKLSGESYYYKAEITGDFNENLYPVEYEQEFKEGAQVMFIKNDYSGENRYFNGKIGVITELSDDEIEVGFEDGSLPTYVERYTWENKNYSLNKETNTIEEKVKGTFSQYPLRLAWAITVHKSQGLTFHKAVIDVSQAFAPGQIYVALSRLVSLEGLILSAPLSDNLLESNQRLKEFTLNKKHHTELEEEYKKELPSFIRKYVLLAFDFSGLREELNEFIGSYNKDEKLSAKQKFKPWAVALKEDFMDSKKVADKFQNQVQKLTNNPSDNWLRQLMDRVIAAKTYFEPILKNFSKKFFTHIKEMHELAGVKKYTTELRDLESLFYSQLQLIYKAEAIIHATLLNKEITKENIESKTLLNERIRALNEHGKKTGKKKKKMNTKDISFQLFKKGKNIEEIAEERNLAYGTIETHLAYFVEEGKLDVSQFVDKKKVSQILQVSKTLDTFRMSEIMEKLGDEFTWSDIRFALADYKSKMAKKE